MNKLVYEPTTFLTNIPLIIMAAICGQKIWAVYFETLHLFYFNLGWSFYSLTIAALAGAFFHGFGPHFNPQIRERIWKIILICLGLTFFFNLIAASAAIFSPDNYPIWCSMFLLGLVTFLVQAIRLEGFGHSVTFFAVGQVLLIIAFSILTLKNTGTGYLNILLSSCLTAVAGWLWTTGWSIHEKFNNNDLFHMIQLASIWLTYRGAILINNAELP